MTTERTEVKASGAVAAPVDGVVSLRFISEYFATEVWTKDNTDAFCDAICEWEYEPSVPDEMRRLLIEYATCEPGDKAAAAFHKVEAMLRAR